MSVSPRQAPKRLIMFLALAGALAVTGCGGSAGTITGTVTYKGHLLKGGTVMFTPAGGGEPKVATILEDGTYTAEKVPVGEATIAVDTAFLRPPPGGGLGVGAKKYEPPPGAPGSNYKPPSDSGANARRYVEIPAKYANPAKSGLKYTVTGGSQKHDIPLD